jgi:hypothetical protein
MPSAHRGQTNRPVVALGNAALGCESWKQVHEQLERFCTNARGNVYCWICIMQEGAQTSQHPKPAYVQAARSGMVRQDLWGGHRACWDRLDARRRLGALARAALVGCLAAAIHIQALCLSGAWILAWFRPCPCLSPPSFSWFALVLVAQPVTRAQHLQTHSLLSHIARE